METVSFNNPQMLLSVDPEAGVWLYLMECETDTRWLLSQAQVKELIQSLPVALQMTEADALGADKEDQDEDAALMKILERIDGVEK